jgi:asparagine synthase (glutamine-hydrolysing)
MCRIAGIWQQGSKNTNNIGTIVAQMRDVLSYGGPDAAGIYVEENLALGHRRLSILDLSEAGTQPIHWLHYTIIFNGEVYNFKEIRLNLELLRYEFSTNTDTEVILKSFHEWGFEAVKRFRGMFAFAIWDKEQQKLLLCRDRVGVKPLYWYFKDGLFMFASELKSFHMHPEFDKTINKDAVSLFLQQGYIQSPYSIFKYAQKVQPGSWLEINASGNIAKHQYWQMEEYYKNNKNTEGGIFDNENNLVEALDSILLDSFKLRMVSDVPVGMFLSGGIDSSIVTAMLQKNTNQQLKTFTIGFEDKRLNEAEHAKSIAQHIGTDHTEIYCQEKDFIEILQKLPDMYDEPFGDSSAIPTHLVSKLAKNQVKVSLSADGGDEIFGGYTKYQITKNLFQKVKAYPQFIKNGTAALLNHIDPNTLETYSSHLPILKNYTGISNKFHKFRQAISSNNLVDFFNRSSTYFSKRELEAIYPHYKERFSTELEPIKGHIIGYLSLIDMQTYLEGDIMTKVDRATMQVALEGREPFLDQNIIEFGLKLSDDFKIKGQETKYLLRKVLYKYVPKELIERPKQGFAVPIEKWLKEYLKDDLRAMIQDAAFFETFDLNKANTSRFIDNFIHEKQYINPHAVWFLLVLYMWYERWYKSPVSKKNHIDL